MATIEFDINGTLYPTKNISDLAIRDYNQLLEIIQQNINELAKIRIILSVLTEIPQELLTSINLESFLQVDWGLLLTQQTELNPLHQKYKLNETWYILPEFNDITFGKWIDIDYFLSNQDENTMLNVIGILFLPIDYTLTQLESIREILNTNLNIIDALTIFDAYNNWRMDLIKQYEGLFQSQESEEEDEDVEDIFEDGELDEDEEEPQTNTGWIDTAYELAGHILKVDEVLERPILSVMNWLTHQKEKADREKEAYEKMKNSH